MESTADSLENSAAAQEEMVKEQASTVARLSVADGLYFLVVLAAALMRFTSLGSTPLSPAEATEAFATWQFLQPNQIGTAIGSPAYFSLTSILIAFLGSSDAVMRLVPAIFGLGLVVLPWFLRDSLGQIGALTTAVLLTVSPLLAATSRTVGGESIALFALLLAAIAGLKLSEGRGQNWLYLLAIAAGLGLSSAPLFYSGLLTLVIARWAQNSLTPEKLKADWLNRSNLIKGSIVAFIVMLTLSTRFFTFPAGIGAAAQLFGDWLTQFNWQGEVQTIIDPFLLLARYEVILIPLGIFSVLWAIWRNNILGILLTYWLLAALILILLQRGVLNNALLIPLPGYLLLGLATHHVLKKEITRWTGAVTAVVLLLGAIILVSVARFLRVSFAGDQQILNIWLALLAVALAALAFYYFWALHDRAIIQGCWLGVLILLVIYQWGTAWHLTHFGANDPRERWVQVATDDELPVLLNTVEKISQRATNSDFDLQLFSAVDSPVLHWYLRDFRQVQIGNTLPPEAQYDVVITPIEVNEPILGSDYLGGDFGLLRMGTGPVPLSSTPITDAMRWWLFHESAMSIPEERIILWVRSDLAYSE
jgi:4-amino-4-deoxy-L-arabinose transferase-like glycosyltransferase